MICYSWGCSFTIWMFSADWIIAQDGHIGWNLFATSFLVHIFRYIKRKIQNYWLGIVNVSPTKSFVAEFCQYFQYKNCYCFLWLIFKLEQFVPWAKLQFLLKAVFAFFTAHNLLSDNLFKEIIHFKNVMNLLGEHNLSFRIRLYPFSIKFTRTVTF